MSNKKYEGKLLHDFGVAMIMISVVVSGIILVFSESDYRVENLIMLLCTIVCIIIGNIQYVTLSIILAAIQAVAFIGLKVFKIMTAGDSFVALSFLWVLVPAIGVCGSILCVNAQKRILLDNELLHRQVDELVMIDPLTGFYNLRSMFMDMQTQVSFAERNNKPISLMVIKLRYNEQLKRALRKNQYEQVLIKMAKYVADTVRLEDRVYCIDDEGSLAIILTTDNIGCKSVVGRLRRKIDSPEAFADIASKPIRAEVKIGYLQYKKEEYQRDARLFLSKVEEEAAYDI